MKTFLSSDKGFGIIEALVALVIASIAMIGLFLGSHFAKVKAYENLHYRKALLKASSVLEDIKYANRKTKTEPKLRPYTTSFILDERNGKPLSATLNVTKNTYSDLTIGMNVRYTRVKVIVSWKEPYSFQQFSGNNEVNKSIALVEDYYFVRR